MGTTTAEAETESTSLDAVLLFVTFPSPSDTVGMDVGVAAELQAEMSNAKTRIVIL
jgi:hypothetical protein